MSPPMLSVTTFNFGMNNWSTGLLRIEIRYRRLNVTVRRAFLVS